MSKVDYEHLKTLLCRIGSYGKDDPKVPLLQRGYKSGISRTFGSIAAADAGCELKKMFEECGMKSYVDGAGNVHGFFLSGQPNAKEIVVASHYDTVVHGGLYDGLLGVVSGTEAAKAIEKNLNQGWAYDLHVIATNGEEGNELGGTFGSRAMMGMLPLESKEWLQKAQEYGYTKEKLKSAILDSTRIACYLELHIEQGPTLFNRGQKIGVVTGIVGLRRYRVTVSGRSNHSGTTMMEDRDDALVKAARLIAEANDLAVEIGHNLVETVSVMDVFPGANAVIPGKVEYTMEIRDEDKAVMDLFMRKFMDLSKKYKEIAVEPIVAKDPVKCDKKLQQLIADICEKKEISYRHMSSGATHDGNAMASKLPIAMIFVPSRNGVSHCKEEWTEWEDCCLGTEILYETIFELMSRPGILTEK